MHLPHKDVWFFCVCVNTKSLYGAQRVAYVCESRRAASLGRAQAQMTELDREGGYSSGAAY